MAMSMYPPLRDQYCLFASTIFRPLSFFAPSDTQEDVLFDGCAAITVKARDDGNKMKRQRFCFQ